MLLSLVTFSLRGGEGSLWRSRSLRPQSTHEGETGKTNKAGTKQRRQYRHAREERFTLVKKIITYCFSFSQRGVMLPHPIGLELLMKFATPLICPKFS